jgi:hypothetical protein
MRPIALSGRVPTKVNLEGGPVEVGDRIAPSSVPGVGKRATFFEDSVGIALEPYDGTTPESPITVFIDLQKGIDIPALAANLLLVPGVASTSASSTYAMGTTTEATGLDFVGRIFAAILARLQNFGIEVADGITHIAHLAAGEFTVGSPDEPAGITLFDPQGRPGCLVADDSSTGRLRFVEGACGSQATSTQPTPAPVESVGSTTDSGATAEASSTEEVSSDPPAEVPIMTSSVDAPADVPQDNVVASP